MARKLERREINQTIDIMDVINGGKFGEYCALWHVRRAPGPVNFETNALLFLLYLERMF